MMTRHTILRSVFAASLVALAVTGCGQMRPAQTSQASQGSPSMDVYEARLAGAQEVPPVNTAATGMAEVQLNKSTNQLTWRVTYSGLSGPATGAHIHGPAAAGANAGIVVPFTNVTAQPISGQATVTQAQVGDLAAGLWYVNVHTAANPGGEIRGQLRRRQ